MTDSLLGLLIHEQTAPFIELGGILKDLSVETWSVRDCDLAGSLIAQYKPAMVFVDLSIWEKSHKQLVGIAKKPDQALNIVVVGTAPDIELYVASIERGAFSYIASPFAHDGLQLIVRSAAMDAYDRRETMARAMLGALPAQS